MSFPIITQKRRVVPRWRSFSKTTLTGELSTSLNKDKKKRLRDDVFFKSYFLSWNSDKNLGTASDVIYYAVSTGCFDLARDQARYIIKRSKDTPIELVNLSKNIINELEGNHHVSSNVHIKLHDLRHAIYHEIRNHRIKLKEWPRNSILWIELARLYTILNEEKKARHAIQVALQLDGQNRYVVRSAIRFYLHLSDIDDIYRIFINQNAMYHDPWILAPYVALQDRLSKSNLRIKNVRSLLDHIDDTQATELAGSLATLELDNGAIKAAKKLFKRSVVMPNDNSLAQAAWAAHKVGVVTKISDYHVPYMYEAITRDSLINGKYSNALQQCMSWMIDEPFSAIPATTGSYIATSFLNKLECAEQFCDFGLQANPTDKMLLNNYAVILAKTGRITEAFNAFAKTNSVDHKSPMIITLMATAGLLMFRSGEIEEGRKMYAESIETAKQMNENESRAMAAIHYAMEEIEVGVLTKDEIRKILDDNVKKIDHPNVKYLKDNVMKKLKNNIFKLQDSS